MKLSAPVPFTPLLFAVLACLPIAQAQQGREPGPADAARAAASRPDPHFHLYLLIGQSNMAGRGTIDAESTMVHPRVLMLDKHREWVPATDPLHFDKPVAGVGPGLAFGKQMAEANPHVRIGLIPCAVGGMSSFETGESRS